MKHVNIFLCLHMSRYLERMTKDSRGEVEQQKETHHKSCNYFTGIYLFIQKYCLNTCYVIGITVVSKQTSRHSSCPHEAYSDWIWHFFYLH